MRGVRDVSGEGQEEEYHWRKERHTSGVRRNDVIGPEDVESERREERE